MMSCATQSGGMLIGMRRMSSDYLHICFGLVPCRSCAKKRCVEAVKDAEDTARQPIGHGLDIEFRTSEVTWVGPKPTL